MRAITALIATPLLLAALLLAGCTDKSAESSVASAREHLKNNDTQAASIELRNALQKNAGLGEARFLFGTILLKDGNAAAAELEFRKAREANYADDLVVPELARSMLMLGQPQKLVDEFGRFRFARSASEASLQTTLAEAYIALGKPEMAAAALGIALEAVPNHAPALIVGARQKAKAGDVAGALAMADDLIGREPRNAEAWNLKGDLLVLAKRDADESLAAYRKALEADAAHYAAHLSVLTILMQQGRLEEAAKQLAELKKYAANDLQTVYFEAQLAYLSRNFRRARELSQQLLKFDADSPRILQLAGAAALEDGAPIEAEAHLSRAAKAVPESVALQRLLIATYSRSGQSAKAVAALEALAAKGGLDPSMYSLAAEAYLQNGDAKKAEHLFGLALERDPEDAKSRTALAVTRLAGGGADVAIRELDSIAGADRDTTADLALVSALLQRRDFDKALPAIDRLAAKRPDSPLAPMLRGRVMLARNDPAAARKEFERALALDPSYYVAAASLATLDMAEKKPDDARKRFESLLARNPNDSQALIALARLQAATDPAGRDKAIALLSRAVDASPNDANARLLLIDALLNTGNHKQALTAAQNAVAAMPNRPELLNALGRAQMVSRETNQAIATYNKLIALQPESPLPHVRLAEAHVANKNYPSAEQSLRRALEIQPDLLEAQGALVLLNLEAKRYQDASKMARTMQEQRPANAVGFMFEGDIQSAQKRWDAAASAYRAALQRGPSTELAIKLHSALYAGGKSADANRFAANWVKARPADITFRLHLGALAMLGKDYPAAEEHYLAVLALQPDSASTLNNLAWVMGQMGKEGAVPYAEKANKLAPGQPQYMDTLAMLLADQKDYAKAIELQKKAVELQPANAGLRLNLAKIYIKAGDKTRARDELDRLANLGKKFSAQSEVTALRNSL